MIAVHLPRSPSPSLFPSIPSPFLSSLSPPPFTPRSRQGQVRPTPEEIQRLMDLPATTDLGNFAAFSGGPPPAANAALGGVPSRLLMQQLYDSGE